MGDDPGSSAESLVVHRLKPVRTDARAPGPAAVRKVQRRPRADRWLKDRKALLTVLRQQDSCRHRAG